MVVSGRAGRNTTLTPEAGFILNHCKPALASWNPLAASDRSLTLTLTPPATGQTRCLPDRRYNLVPVERRHFGNQSRAGGRQCCPLMKIGSCGRSRSFKGPRASLAGLLRLQVEFWCASLKQRSSKTLPKIAKITVWAAPVGRHGFSRDYNGASFRLLLLSRVSQSSW